MTELNKPLLEVAPTTLWLALLLCTVSNSGLLSSTLPDLVFSVSLFHCQPKNEHFSFSDLEV